MSGFIEAFLAALVFSLLGELADKTQLLVLGLAMKYKAPFMVFLGAVGGHLLIDAIAVLIGVFLGFAFSSNIIQIIVAIFFMALGLWTLYKVFFKKRKKKGKTKEFLGKTPFLATFLMIVFSEIGDKTQIAAGLLGAKYLRPIPIILGITLGLAIATGFTIIVGTKIAEKVPRKTVKIVTGVLFILYGIIALVF